MASDRVKELLKQAQGKKEFLKENNDVVKLLENSMPVDSQITFIGRPRIIDSPETMEILITDYFESCKGRALLKDGEAVFDKNNRPVLVGGIAPSSAGLAYALGFEARASLNDYLKKPDYSNLVRRALLLIETYNVDAGYDRDKSQGARFILSAVHGYITTKETAHTGTVEVKHSAVSNMTNEQKLKLAENATKYLAEKIDKDKIVEVPENDLESIEENDK